MKNLEVTKQVLQNEYKNEMVEVIDTAHWSMDMCIDTEVHVYTISNNL